MLVAILCAGVSSAWGAEVTLKYSGSTTGNFGTDNVASTVGLNANDWSIIASKGSASNNVGYNSAGDIRLYYNAGGSNTLTVSSLTNATINSITITFTGTNYSNAKVTVGGNTVTGTNGKYDINSTSFVITNGNTSNVQVRISQIVINYTSSGGQTTTYTVTYNANGGSGTMTDSNSPYNSGASVSVLGNSFTRDGYTFDNWNTAADGSGTSYDEDDTFTINDNTTLYAQWTENSGDNNKATLTATNLELTGSSYQSDTKTINGITYSFADLMPSSENIQAKASSGTIKNTTAYPGDITSVVITHSGTARATTINGSADGTNWTQVATGSGSITADFSGKGYKYFQITRGSNAAYWTKIEITYSTSSSSLDPSDLTITNQSSALSFDLYNNSTAQVINYTTSSTGAITIEPASPTSYFSYVHDATNKTITVTPLEVTPSAQTVTISQAADDDYYAGTATFTVSIANSNPDVPGTENSPYTVAQARAAIDAGTGITDVYVTGIISQIDSYNSSYGSITYWISDDGTTTDQLEVYSGLGIDGATFSSKDDIVVGASVVVCGTLKKYNSTYEFNYNNYQTSYSAPAIPRITANNVTLEYDATSGEIAYTIDNPATGVNLTASLQQGIDWISNITVTSDKVTFTTTANEGNDDRSATITLSYTGATDKVITVTQKHYVADYATLPFSFDGGSSAIANTAGLTQESLGSDYNNSPKLKFDGTGDFVILKINERPGTLSYTIKGNSFSSGSTSTFKVQTSEDGTLYTDLATYTELGDAQNESFSNLGKDVRYIKWIYTEKGATNGGNVALGNISLTAYVTPVPFDLTVTLNDNIDAIFVFNTADENEPLIEDGAAGTVQVVAGTEIMVSPDVASGYVLESLTVGGQDMTSQIDGSGAYTFTMPSQAVTITATAKLAPVTVNYTLASNITSGKHYVIASGTSGEVKVMSTTQNNNNRGVADGSVSGTTLSVESDAGAAEVVIYGPDASGNYTIYDAAYNDNAGGYLYAISNNNYLRTQGTNDASGLWTISIDESTSVATVKVSFVNGETTTDRLMRYNSSNTIFSCYTTGQKDIYIYEKSGEATPTESKTLNASGYATYCSQNALDFSEATGGTAWAITAANSTTGVITFSQIEGSVPAGTGMLLMGTANGSITMPSATGATALSNNLLEGTTAAKNVTDGQYYGLSGNTFVPVNAGTVPAGKALLPASEVSSNVKSFTFVFEGADGIKTVEHVSAEEAAEIFNLAGQRLQKAQRGVNIINGKKVLVK